MALDKVTLQEYYEDSLVSLKHALKTKNLALITSRKASLALVKAALDKVSK